MTLTEKPVRKRGHEDISIVKCKCGCEFEDSIHEFVPCGHKRNCLALIHKKCSHKYSYCLGCKVK